MRRAAVAIVVALAATASPAVAERRHPTWGNGARDVVRCGGGHDVVNADPLDRVGDGCESVSIRVASDPVSTRGAQHGTIAEPHLAVSGDDVVAVYQAGRYESGAAAAIGYATSRDGGATWRTGLLPAPAGLERVSDPVVARDPVRGVWLAATLAVTPGARTAVTVTRSADGISWDEPIVVARGSQPGLDKEWIACDAWPASPRRGRCYISYTNETRRGIEVRRSDDGGLTWSAPTSVGDRGPGQLGAVAAPRPDGTVAVVWLQERARQLSALSRDGGSTFEAPVTVSEVLTVRAPGIRSVEIPSAATAPDGRLLVAWHGCIAGCTRSGIVVASSADGARWVADEVARVPGTAFAPALAISPTGTAAVVFYTLRPRGIDAWLARSRANGRWKASLLSALPMRRAWLARSRLGAMLGDYIGLAFVGERPLGVLPLARPQPPSGRLRQPLFAMLRVG